MTEEIAVNKGMVDFYGRVKDKFIMPPSRPFEVKVDTQQFDVEPFKEDNVRRNLEDEPQNVVGPPKPTITSVTPNNSRVEGGIYVTIRGTGFVEGAQVKFGENVVPQADTDVNNSTTIFALVQAHEEGTVDLVVQNIPGVEESEARLVNGFSYFSFPHHYTLLHGPSYVYSNNYYLYQISAFKADGTPNTFWKGQGGGFGLGWIDSSSPTEMAGLNIQPGATWQNGVITLAIALLKVHLTAGTQTSVTLYPWDFGPMPTAPLGSPVINAPAGYTSLSNKGQSQSLQLYY